MDIKTLETTLQNILQHNDREELIKANSIIEKCWLDLMLSDVALPDDLNIIEESLEDETPSHDDVDIKNDLEDETMKTYLVSYSILGTGTVHVQAESEEQSIEKTYCMNTDPFFNEVDFKGGFEVDYAYEE